MLIIFTDLDGTLIDAGYSFNKALPALEMIRRREIPLVLCSSKTRTEIEFYRDKLQNRDPFISENGGGIYIPEDYDQIHLPGKGLPIERDENYTVIRLGTKYDELRKALHELRRRGFPVIGFGDMTDQEVFELTGLDETEVRMAKQREYDEPFICNGDDVMLQELRRHIRDMGYCFTQGVLCHILGDHDKGRAVSILIDLYSGVKESVVTAALGDSPNDIEMLRKVDYPFLVQKSDGSYDNRVEIEGLIKVEGAGPAGWNDAVLKLLETF